jgi:hypothetical protein
MVVADTGPLYLDREHADPAADKVAYPQREPRLLR